LIGRERTPVPDVRDEPDTNVWRGLEGELCAWAERRDGRGWIHVPEVASYSFASDGDEVRAVPHPSASEGLVRTAYLRSVLPMTLQALGREVLHASAVLCADGVVGFCAVSTTGKTTIATELARRGYPFWADDALVFEPANGVVNTVWLPYELRVRSSVDVSDIPWTPAERISPLAATCVLERSPIANGGGPATVRRLAESEAFVAVLTHAYCFSLDDADRNRRMMDKYLELVQTVPVFRVTFNPGLNNLPLILDRIEDALGMSTAVAS
jgi:hypothetical protein